MRTLTRLTLAALAAVAFAACSAESDDGTATGTTEAGATTTTTATPAGASIAGEPDEVDDVTVGEQRVDELGWMVATLNLANNSSEPSTYLIEFVFEDAAGHELYRGMASSANVQPNGTASTLAQSTTEPLADGQFKVQLISVERLAS